MDINRIPPPPTFVLDVIRLLLIIQKKLNLGITLETIQLIQQVPIQPILNVLDLHYEHLLDIYAHIIDMDILLHTLNLRQINVRTEAWPRVARDPYIFWILTGETEESLSEIMREFPYPRRPTRVSISEIECYCFLFG